MADETENELTFVDRLDILIDTIEKSKARVRIEYDNDKEAYRARGKLVGYTKRQTEDRLMKLHGEAMGYEGALSVLYIERQKYNG